MNRPFEAAEVISAVGIRLAELRQSVADIQHKAVQRLELFEAQVYRGLAEQSATVSASIAVLERTLSEARERVSSLKDGEPGARGEVGSEGPRGLQGERGVPGEPGRQGEPGERGNDGRNGLDGASGSPGERGAEGVAGRDGVDGVSGQAGAAGRDGEPGPVGPPGLAGDHGVVGLAGAAGPAGPAGLQGERGPEGLPGPIGVAGARGEVGPGGPPGAPGLAGERGASGERGPEGPAGKLPLVKAWSDRVHYEGEVVSHAGSAYQALRDTGREPPHDDWCCIAAAGRDGADGRSFTVRGTWTDGGEYRAFDVVALGGASFVAKWDNPGPCPGDGWQLAAAQGKRGNQGDRGPAGPKGERGEPGAIIAADVDNDGLLILTNGDGSVVTCDLYPLLAKALR